MSERLRALITDKITEWRSIARANLPDCEATSDRAMILHRLNICADELEDLLTEADPPVVRPLSETETKLKWLRKFVEYARYELQPGEAKMGSQFPHQADADKAMAMIDELLAEK